MARFLESLMATIAMKFQVVLTNTQANASWEGLTVNAALGGSGDGASESSQVFQSFPSTPPDALERASHSTEIQPARLCSPLRHPPALPTREEAYRAPRSKSAQKRKEPNL